MPRPKTVKLTQVSLLAALIVVLQLLSCFIKIGTFNLSLVLVPIIVGGALFGAKTGAFLGGVFGVVATVASATGLDVGGAMMWTFSPWLTAGLCVAKGALAGLAGGVVSTVFFRHNKPFLGVLLSGIVTPVVNTGIFCLGAWFLFRNVLAKWQVEAGAQGQDILLYLLLGVIGVNFLIELVVNLILSSATERIIRTVKRIRH